MCLTEYDEEQVHEWFKEEGIEEGIEKGIEKGIGLHLIEQVQKKVNKGKTLEEIAKDLEEEPEGIRKIYDLVVSMEGASPETILNKL